MPLKLNIGLSRKVGEDNYGSRGASINLEVELDQGVLNDPEQLRCRVQDLYQLARSSVDEELRRSADPDPREVSSVNGNGNGNGHARHHDAGYENGHTSSGHSSGGNGHRYNGPHQNRIEVARATQSQIRAIFAITKRQGLDSHKIISDRFHVHKMEDLTIREASSLIDELKNGSAVRS